MTEPLRRVLLTGASSGVGAALARELAGPGVQLLLLARRADALRAVADDCRARGADAEVLVCDLRDVAQVAATAGRILTVGAPDVVVANAGLSIARPVLAQADRLHDYQRSLGANLTGHLGLLLPLLPAMASRGGGQVVVVTTATAFVPAPGWQTYAASKAALATWARSVRPELRARGVDVAEVALGLVRTPMSEPTYGRRPLLAESPERAARRIARVIEHPRALTAPAWSRVLGAASMLAPGAVGALTARVARGGR